jgi:hypothetical protein
MVAPMSDLRVLRLDRHEILERPDDHPTVIDADHRLGREPAR